MYNNNNLSIDMVKYLRPYLYNYIYNRSDAIGIISSFCKEHKDCSDDIFFTMSPYGLHIRMVWDADGFTLMNNIIYRLLIHFKAIVLDCLKQMFMNQPVDILEMYKFILNNVQFLYTGCILRVSDDEYEFIAYL